jgi:hypothetical protein
MSTNFLDDSRGKRIKLLRVGRVTDNSDPSDIGALKVRIDGVDSKENEGEEILCLPLLPRFINVLPDVNQGVFVFSAEHVEGLEITNKSERFWIGPITGQLPDLDKEDKDTGIAGFLRGWVTKNKSRKEIPQADGAYPEKDEIALQGRGSGDFILKKNETVLRIGKFKNKDRRIFNDTNLGYIQLKSGDEDIKKRFVDEEFIKIEITPPVYLIRVFINSILNDGTILPNNSTEQQFLKASTHEVILQNIDLKTNTIKSNASTSFNTRGEAVEEVLLALGTNDQGFFFNNFPNEDFDLLKEKWQLYTEVIEVLDAYATEDSSSYETFTVTFPGSEKEVKATKKVLKLDKKNKGVDSSVINVVADKINLISHDGNHTFELTDKKNLITSEEQTKIHSDPKNGGAQSVVFGEKLVEFLELVRNYVNSHVHPFPGLPSDPEITKLNVLEFDLQSILNKNIKTN